MGIALPFTFIGFLHLLQTGHRFLRLRNVTDRDALPHSHSANTSLSKLLLFSSIAS